MKLDEFAKHYKSKFTKTDLALVEQRRKAEQALEQHILDEYGLELGDDVLMHCTWSCALAENIKLLFKDGGSVHLVGTFASHDDQRFIVRCPTSINATNSQGQVKVFFGQDSFARAVLFALGVYDVQS